MKKLKFNLLFLATVATLCSQPVLAGLNSYTHANGSTVVNINQADANGLSHNMFQTFDVNSHGMVINNSTTDLLREQGNIARNSNLDKSASLILNEVISKNPSSLNGYIEVAGQKADIVIANPNGITCSGCSFINTGRTTLTTGKPVFSDGALAGFNVASGTVTVKGNGLKGADYTDLLAQKIAIQGQIEAKQLRAIAGNYTYDSTTGLATASGKRQLSNNSIDVSALGGVTAGIIQLQTTGAGMGVNNSGILNAAGLYISSNGTLTNSGSIQTTVLSASAAGGITNKGTLAASQAVMQTMDTFTNSGTIKTAGPATMISVGKFVNQEKAQINASGALTIASLVGDIENKGTLSTPDTLSLQTGYNTVDGVVKAVANTSLLNSGSIQAGNLSMTAVKEISLLSGGKVAAQGNAYLSAATLSNAGTLSAMNASLTANSVTNQGLMQTTGLLSIWGKNGITNTDTIKAGVLELATDEKISNASCKLWLFCTKGTMSADKITITAPKIKSISDLDGYYKTTVLELNKPAAASLSDFSL